MIRGSGLADILPTEEPKLKALVAELYGLPGPAERRELSEIAEAWRPLRTWAAVLIRAAADRLQPSGSAPPNPSGPTPPGDDSSAG